MLKHGRAGVPMEVMGLMLGEFVDDYTVRVIDVFAMPQSGTVSHFTRTALSPDNNLRSRSFLLPNSDENRYNILRTKYCRWMVKRKCVFLI